MNGNGRVFKRGQLWWIAFDDGGREHRESSRSRERKDAVKMLRQRLGEVAAGTLHAPQRPARTVTMQDLFDLVETNFQLNARTSPTNGANLARMRKKFGKYPVQACTGLVISQYMAAKQKAGR